MTLSQEIYQKKQNYFSDFIELGKRNTPHPEYFEWEKIQNNYKDKTYNPSDMILDSTECYMAALKIEENFPGPALLLYVSAINIFATGEDEELKNKILNAKKLIKKSCKSIWNNQDIQDMFQAAMNKAKNKSVNNFLKKEFKDALYQLIGIDSEYLSSEIVDATHKVRHEAKIDQFSNHIIEEQDDKGNKMSIRQFNISDYRILCSHAKDASARCVFKRIKENMNL